MDYYQNRNRIPIQVKRSNSKEKSEPEITSPVGEGTPPVVDYEEALTTSPEAAEVPSEEEAEITELMEELEQWRDRALRLQAEIDNFRKRQRRLAEDRIAEERERLLHAFLTFADNLGHVLAASEAEEKGLQQGAEIIYQDLMRFLHQEGVNPIEAEGKPFDQAWHDAVDTVSHQQAEVEPDTVVEVVQQGYRLGERPLRPARVIVAV